MRMRRMLAFVLSLSLALGGLFLLPSGGRGEEAEEMRLLSVNVGKADCHLLQWEGQTWMIDTGTGESWGAVSAALLAMGVDRLAGVVLTHTHKDHAGGALALASSSIAVDAWYAPAYYTEVTEKKHPAVLAAALRGQGVTWLKAGDSLPFGSGRLTVLGPVARDADKENNNSLVLLAEAAGGSVLLTGDMEQPEEESLLRAGVLAPVTVLKVGNHGEGDATGETFALAVRPQVAVISTNSVAEPDTPSKRVLKLLKKAGATIALTESAAGGVLTRVRDGKATASLVSWEIPPLQGTGVVLEALDPEEDLLTLRNTGAETADLSGWFVRSDRGLEVFVFPAGTTLAPGAALTLATLSSGRTGDLLWREKNVWHDKKAETARLFDAWGRELGLLESGD